MVLMILRIALCFALSQSYNHSQSADCLKNRQSATAKACTSTKLMLRIR